LIIAYVLASLFVEPTSFLRRIHETAKKQKISAPGAAAADLLEPLTPREKAVAVLKGQGLKNKEIADELFMSPETVKSHVSKIYEKTGLNRVDLLVYVNATRGIALQQPDAV
jgi:DNA-binding NarL/FixJ family response regulator